MPEIDLIPEVLHQPLDPYHYVFDNLPLRNILTRIDLVNSAVDQNSAVLRESIGDQGSLSNRLAQSLNVDGTLNSAAIDLAYHNIAKHTDGDTVLSSDQLTSISSLGYVVYNPVSFVRMLSAERAKLAEISDEATALRIQFPGASVFTDAAVSVEDSESVTWTVTTPNHVQAHLAFPAQAAHNHVYDATPAHANTDSPDYTNYKSTSVATSYRDGSLRVYVNGIRLSQTSQVYVRVYATGEWILTSFTADPTAGTFALNRALAATDVIRIDFDTSLV